jgi:ZIP family zinc transporter
VRWSVPQAASDAMLGFAAGVMLSASYFSLILPGIAAAENLYGGTTAAALVAAGGIALGAAFVAGLNELLPHEHFIAGREGADTSALGKIWLFVIAITIHNFPEGLAVGVGFGGGDVENGTSLAVGIGLQNAPEGLAVAVALVGQGYSRMFAFLVALATGLIEPVGGLIGVVAVHSAEVLLPWGLTFAAGAMLYIISHEIIPETHRRGHQDAATTGLIVGLILMMLLDVALG